MGARAPVEELRLPDPAAAVKTIFGGVLLLPGLVGLLSMRSTDTLEWAIFPLLPLTAVAILTWRVTLAVGPAGITREVRVFGLRVRERRLPRAEVRDVRVEVYKGTRTRLFEARVFHPHGSWILASGHVESQVRGVAKHAAKALGMKGKG